MILQIYLRANETKKKKKKMLYVMRKNIESNVDSV